MTKEEAFEVVAGTLSDLMYEAYEGDEWDDPDIIEWVKKNEEAMEILRDFV